MKPSRHVRSIWFFSILAFSFVVSLAVVAWLIDLQQRRVLDETQHMQTQTMPETVRLQRLGRNLEQMRSTGDQLVSEVTPEARQNAQLIIALMSRLPSIQEYKETALVVDQATTLLAAANLAIVQDPESMRQWRQRWQPLAQQLSLAADEAMTKAAHLMTSEIEDMSAVARKVRYQLLLTMLFAGMFILAFIWFLQLKILRPLLHIHSALLGLRSGAGAPQLPESNVVEIKAIESAIIALHDTKKENETVHQELVYQANHDMLTGLPNRRHFMGAAERALTRAKIDGRSAVVGLADIDFFKRVNDEYSHAAGDEVLRQCAQLLSQIFRSTDLICRYGGEEFAFVFLESDLAECRNLAERLRIAVAEHEFVLANGQRLRHLSISLGLACAGPQGLEQAMGDADDALYLAKSSGRNVTVVSMNAVPREAPLGTPSTDI